MNRSNRTQLALGIVLILLGVSFVATKQVPALAAWVETYFDWPMWVIGVGAILLLIGLIVGAPGMAVPACIVAGIGGILYYQNVTGKWESWSYMWSLIPGLVGIGTILTGLLGENTRANLAHGLNLLVVSACLFLVFATFFGGVSLLGNYGAAVLLILLGIYVIARGLFRRQKPKE